MLLLKLSRLAYELFTKQGPRQKRRLLNFLVSNRTRKHGGLEVTYRQPFDLIPEMNSVQEKNAVGISSRSLFESWLPFVEAYQTLFFIPTDEIKKVGSSPKELVTP